MKTPAHDKERPKHKFLTKQIAMKCRHCGESVRMQVDKKQTQGRCPACGWAGPLSSFPAATAPAVSDITPKPLQPPPPLAVATDNSYGVAGPTEIRCPHCRKVLEREVKECQSCGYNLETGEVPEQVFEPIECCWEAGWPFRRRLTVFLVAQAAVLLFGLTGAILSDTVGMFFGAWVPFTCLSAFLLGTFSRLDMARKENGRVRLTQSWRFAFYKLPKTTYRLGEFEGVATGKVDDNSWIDWLIFGGGIVGGIIPGLLFWYFVIRRESYFVALTKDHGFPTAQLYRGWSQTQARDIADTLHEIADLPLS
jgi:hypothetical protein